jgi:hypothetical protein
MADDAQVDLASEFVDDSDLDHTLDELVHAGLEQGIDAVALYRAILVYVAQVFAGMVPHLTATQLGQEMASTGAEVCDWPDPGGSEVGNA